MAKELKWPGGVAALRREMSNWEWQQWLTYYKLEAQDYELERLKAEAKAGRKH